MSFGDQGLKLKRVDILNLLNTDASLMPQPQLDIVPEQVFEGENRLIVFIPNPKYMLAMKLLAARPEDLSDAIALARRTGLRKYRDMIILMEESYPSEVQEHFDVNFISEVASRIQTG